MLNHNPFQSNLFEPYVQIIANPAAGADATTPAPVNQRSWIVGVNFEFVTSADVFDRNLRIRRQRGAQVQYLGLDKYAQTATQQHYYLAGIGLGQSFHAATIIHNIPLLPTPAFLTGDILIIEFINMQTADQILNVTFTWHMQIYPQ